MSFLKAYAHWIVLAAAGVLVAVQARPPSAHEGQIDLNEFGKLPVQHGGRIKPLDSLARSSLLLISNQQEFKDKDGHKHPAIKWLIEVMCATDPRRGPVAEYELFRIENYQVLNLLGLPAKPGWYRYSLAEIQSGYDRFIEALERAKAKDDKQQDDFDGKVLELGRRLFIYQELAEHRVPQAVPPSQPDGKWRTLAEVDAAIAPPSMRRAAFEHVLDQVREWLKKEGKDPDELPQSEHALLARLASERAEKMINEIIESKRPAVSPPADAFMKVLEAYREGKADRFNTALNAYRTNHLVYVSESDVTRAGSEAFLNHFTPFYLAGIMYAWAILFGCLSWLYWHETFRKAAFWLVLLGWLIHTATLLARMYLMDRPFVFVTNLYSSAVFIGWAAVLGGLVLELIFRNGIGLVSGAVTGGATAIIAHNLLATAGNADSLEMLQAVLDTNFWLATHVSAVTLGYAATWLSGILGILYIVLGLFTPALSRKAAKILTSMMYATVCFATLLSFTGTVLGGIWADYSWGRFWGWDPKENGAVLIVIWNALILHARWGGMIKQRGLAVLCVAGSMFVVWSWFGTNQLGVGLHAYGFSNTLALFCTIMWGFYLCVIAAGLVPLRYWWSVREQAALQAALAGGPKARKLFPQASR
jgi:ABC-type transport system involved in cytochrome c biogenesis permease subunit